MPQPAHSTTMKFAFATSEDVSQRSDATNNALDLPRVSHVAAALASPIIACPAIGADSGCGDLIVAAERVPRSSLIRVRVRTTAPTTCWSASFTTQVARSAGSSCPPTRQRSLSTATGSAAGCTRPNPVAARSPRPAIRARIPAAVPQRARAETEQVLLLRGGAVRHHGVRGRLEHEGGRRRLEPWRALFELLDVVPGELRDG